MSKPQPPASEKIWSFSASFAYLYKELTWNSFQFALILGSEELKKIILKLSLTDQKQPELEPLPYSDSSVNTSQLLQLMAEVGTEQQWVKLCGKSDQMTF